MAKLFVLTWNCTVSQNNVPPLACYNFDAHEWILIFFGRNVTDKAGNQKTLYYATSSDLCFCTTWQNTETRKSHTSLNWIVLNTRCTCALSSWKKKMSSVMCLIASDIYFVEVVRYPINTVHWLLLQAWRRTTPIFTQRVTAWQTWLTQSTWVTHSRMLCSFPRSCLVLPLDHFDSEGSFSSRWYF